MSGEPGTALDQVLARLASLDVADWRGLPHLVPDDAADADGPAAAMLGATFARAYVVSLATPPSATGARAWLRDQRIVLVDVALDGEVAAPSLPDSLGEPERRLDVAYGLRYLPSGEWIYAARGLALVVDDEQVRHVMGFVPCGADEYERRLRIRFETTRRPLSSQLAQEDL